VEDDNSKRSDFDLKAKRNQCDSPWGKKKKKKKQKRDLNQVHGEEELTSELRPGFTFGGLWGNNIFGRVRKKKFPLLERKGSRASREKRRFVVQNKKKRHLELWGGGWYSSKYKRKKWG